LIDKANARTFHADSVATAGWRSQSVGESFWCGYVSNAFVMFQNDFNRMLR